MPEKITIPFWIISVVIVPIAVGIATVLYRIGVANLERYETALQEREEEAETMRKELQEIKEQMASDHGSVNGGVEGLKEELREIKSILKNDA